MSKRSFSSDEKTWRVVSEYTESIEHDVDFLNELEQYLSAKTIDFIRVEYAKLHRAIILSLTDLIEHQKQASFELSFEGIHTVSDNITHRLVVHSFIEDDKVLSDLFTKKIYSLLPKNAGFYGAVYHPPDQSHPHLNLYRSFGITKFKGILKVIPHLSPQLIFHLFEFPSASEYIKKNLSKGALKKVPEGDDNIQGRERWFQRRSGRREE